MKTIAVHSHKGGVGKTTVALFLAKHAVALGQKVCVVDFDFIGSGMADLFVLEKEPDSYLENYFLDANPDEFELQQLLGKYTDKDMKPQKLSVILNLGKGLPSNKDTKKLDDLETDMIGLMANEPHYRVIQTQTEILLDKLIKNEVKLTIVDCHPGLSFVSETMREIANLNIYMTTPDRSDCFGLLKSVNLKKLDNSKSFLILNMAEESLTDLDSFQYVMKNDEVVGTDAQALFPNLEFIGKKEAHFAIIPESELLRRIFYIGSLGYLPPILRNKDEFNFCSKVMSLINGGKE